MTFKKGISGNPSGRPKLSREMKAVRTMGAEEMARIMSVLLLPPADAVAALEAEDKPPSLLMTQTVNAIRGGDMKTLNAFMDRVFGKAPAILKFEDTTKRIPKKTLDRLEALRLANEGVISHDSIIDNDASGK